MLKKQKSKIDKVIGSNSKVIAEGVDVKSVIGEPISCGNDVIIPVSKITTCYLGGGGEYGEVKLFSKNNTHPFAGGSGTIVSVSPLGFLIGGNGNYNFVKSTPDILDEIAEKTFDTISKITGENQNE